MKKIFTFYILVTLISIFIINCDNDDPTTPSVNGPKIDSLITDKKEILADGSDKAIITCYASGDNLSYLWEVGFGDIIPINAEASEVTFAGATCCIGEQTIKCTVSNDLGRDSKTIGIILK